MNELEGLIHELASTPSRLSAMTAEQRDGLLAALRIAVSDAPAQRTSSTDLLTVSEAAALLKVTARWLYRHAGKLPFTRRLSRKVLRFSRTGLERWIAARRT